MPLDPKKNTMTRGLHKPKIAKGMIDPGIEPGTFSVELLQLIHFVNET